MTQIRKLKVDKRLIYYERQPINLNLWGIFIFMIMIIIGMFIYRILR